MIIKEGIVTPCPPELTVIAASPDAGKSTFTYLTNPANKIEQINGVINLWMEDEDNALRDIFGDRLPRILNFVAIKMFKQGASQGYQPFVIRSAIKQLDDVGFIDFDGPPYEMD